MTEKTPPIQLTIPISSGRNLLVYGGFPISETEWEQMLNVLEVMKPGLVKQQEQPEEPAQ
jgi:hypothetical protein